MGVARIMDANQQRGRGAPSTSGQRAIVRPFETPSSPDVYRELEQQLHDTERGRLGHRAEELSNLSDAIATEIHPLSLQVLQLARAHQLSVQLDSETIDHPLICRILEQYSNGNDLSGHSELEKRVKHNLDRFLIPHGERELAASVARVSTAFKVFSHGLDALIEDEILSEPEVSKLRSILAEIVDSQTALTTLKGEELSAAHSEQSDQVAQMFDAIQDLVELVGSDSAGFPQLVAAHIRRRETARLAELDRELLNHLTDLSQDSAPALDAALSPKARLHRMLLAHTLEEVFDSVSLLKAFSHPTLLSTSDAMYLSSDLEARFEHVGHSAAQLSKETGLEATESQRLIVTKKILIISKKK